MGTWNGALALGLETQLGTLETGNGGRVAMVALGDVAQRDPFLALFHPESRVTGLLLDPASIDPPQSIRAVVIEIVR